MERSNRAGPEALRPGRMAVMAALASAAALQPAPVAAEIRSYAYDAQGRLVGAVRERGAADMETAIYWYDPASNRSKTQAVASSASIVPIFQFAKAANRHFYTNYFPEGVGAGFAIEGHAFNLYRYSAAGLAPIYRCYAPAGGDHFVSGQGNCEGFTTESLMGYASSSPGTGLVPLYRFYRSSDGDHLQTTDHQAGIDGGYTLEGILGYVP